MNRPVRQQGTRPRKTSRISPMTRAVRDAMAVSVAMLGLSAGPAAHAATPGAAAVHGVVSPGRAHTATAADIAPVDLTRVDADEHPASTHAFPALRGAAFAADIEALTQIDNHDDRHASGYGIVQALYAIDDVVRVDNDASITADALPPYAGGYAAAIGVRAGGGDIGVDNLADGFIGATAGSDGGRARARAIYASGYAGTVSVSNEGGIRADAQADGGRAESHGIYAFGYGGANDIRNAGDIEASARSEGGFGYATGITAIGYGSGDNVSAVANTGSIHAESDATYAYAFGVFNLTRQRDGSAYLANDGDILAEATGELATATGAFNLALRYGDAAMVNTGDIEAIADGTQGGVATGIYSYANVQDVSVENSGLVHATGSGDKALATGIYARSSLYGATSVVNDGDVAAHAYGNAGFAHAAGIVAQSETTVDATNNEDIDVVARTVDGAALAMGMYATATQTATLRNYGNVSVIAESAYGDAAAYGIFEYVGGAGIGLAINGGDIQVAATGGAGARADATGINVVGDVASVFNDGSVGVVATAGEGGLADARAARAYGAYTNVANYGSLSATADAEGGSAMARGADSLGGLGASVYNAGDIQASATADGGSATAFGSYSTGMNYGGYTDNLGTVSSHASGDSARAYGTFTASMYYGNAITSNAGDISAIAEGGIAEYGEAEAIAIGAYSSALVYDAVVDNDGSISATATALADISGTYGFLQAKAVGAQAVSAYGYGDAVIANGGLIEATALASQGYASAWGAAVQSSGMFGGASMIDNDGGISAYAHADIGVASATGAYVLNLVSDADIVNHGDIGAGARAELGIPGVSVDYAYATGVKDVSAYGNASVANYGSITASATGGGAITGARGIQAGGVYVSITNAEGASIDATGEVDLFGGGFATGIEANGIYGVDVVNDGDITAYGHAHAYSEGAYGFYGAGRATGIYAAAGFQGNVAVVNNGDITAVALAEDSVSVFQGGAGASGIDTYAKYDATVVNAGDINALAQTQFGIAGSYGAIVHGKYSSSLVNAAGSNIISEASAGSLAGDGYGGRAVSFGVHMFGNGMEHGGIYNDGRIVSHATSTADAANPNPGLATAFGAAVGAYSNVLAGTVANHGDIEAAANADFGYATAYAAFVQAAYDAGISNTSDIFASATAKDGNAFVVGAHAYSSHATVTYDCTYVQGPYGGYNQCDYSNPHVTVDGGVARIDNHGDIAAVAQASGGEGYSYGASSIGAFSAEIDNTGSIAASTAADIAKATGALVRSSNGDASLVNGGDIVANATGSTSTDATGAWVEGLDGATVENSGRILAGAYGADATATALRMGDTGDNVLTNDGTIGAFGDGMRIAVWSGTDASANIANRGTLIGAIVTGDLDDTLANAAGGNWQAVGTSDFGAGDDAIANHGTIFMDDAILRMGGASGDATLAASGGNAFDNSGVLAVSGAGNLIDMGAGNPSPFTSNGMISFIDGAPDDVLTIVGDFAGEGAIDLDVSGLHSSADRLYIDGNVVDSSVQALNVNLADMPTQASSDIALVTVEGAATTDTFVLSNVAHAPGFLAWDFSLHSQASASGNVFSLGIDATGLNTAGVLAANAASGAAGMLDAQVGTFRQRMGVDPFGGEGKVLAAFFRAWDSTGDVDPTHAAANFGQGGDFAYDLHASGQEVGINANLPGNVHVGLVLGNADGRQRLAADGAGSTRMDGMTWGAYATWLAPQGFYLDLSARGMAVDIASTSSAGRADGRARTHAWNLEAGYEWKLRGLSIVPQLQYTRTEVEDARSIQADGSMFESQGTSSRGRLGVEIAKPFESGGIRWTPYASINAVREFDGRYAYTAAGAFDGETGTRGTSVMGELGLGMQARGWGFTIGAQWTDGGAFESTVGAQALVRFAW
jgi:outer membrane autotransporter protein